MFRVEYNNFDFYVKEMDHFEELLETDHSHRRRFNFCERKQHVDAAGNYFMSLLK